MEEIALLVVAVHGEKVKFRDTREVPDDVGLGNMGNILDGLREMLILGHSCLKG